MRSRMWCAPAIVGVLCIALTGCVGAERSGGSSTYTPPASLAPGNGQGSKGTPEPQTTIEPVLVTAVLEDDGSAITASGYVAGLIETSGTCTFEFSGVSGTRTVESEALADVSTTSCGTVQLPRANLATGVWTVTLLYTSASVPRLRSIPQTVEVP